MAHIWKKPSRYCDKCGLYIDRRTPFIGYRSVGVDDKSPHPAYVFVGESPGRVEERMGLPFVGPAGELLQKEIDQFDYDNYLFANVIRCALRKSDKYPPEEAFKRPFIGCVRHLKADLLQWEPYIVIILGRFASRVLVHNMHSIRTARGKLYRYSELPLEFWYIITYHPASLLGGRGSPATLQAFRTDLRMANKVGKLIEYRKQAPADCNRPTSTQSPHGPSESPRTPL